MIDLQRILACLNVGSNNVDARYLAAVSKASDSFSSRLVMAMNAQVEWRPVSGCFQLAVCMFEHICFESFPIQPTPHARRQMWSRVLQEAKTFSEQVIPSIDLPAFVEACKQVTALEALTRDSPYSKEQRDAVEHMLSLILPLTTINVKELFNDKEEDKKLFMEQLQALAAWYRGNFKPDFDGMSGALASWVDSVAPAQDGIQMSQLADEFPPSVEGIPSSFDEIFDLQSPLSFPTSPTQALACVIHGP